MFNPLFVHIIASGHLRNLIYQRTDVAPCNQLLTGWDMERTSDNLMLKNCGMPKEVKLLLASLASENE